MSILIRLLTFPGLIVLVFAVPVIILFIPTVETVPVVELSDQDRMKIERLFTENRLSLNHVIPYRIFEPDEPDEKEILVWTFPKYKNVKVEFREDWVFEFDRTGTFIGLAGHPIPNLSLSAVEGVDNSTLVSDDRKESYFQVVRPYERPIDLSTQPRYPAVLAALRARIHPDMFLTWIPPKRLHAQLVVYDLSHLYPPFEPQRWALVWKVTPDGEEKPFVVIDAVSGVLLESFHAIEMVM